MRMMKKASQATRRSGANAREFTGCSKRQLVPHDTNPQQCGKNAERMCGGEVDRRAVDHRQSKKTYEQRVLAIGTRGICALYCMVGEAKKKEGPFEPALCFLIRVWPIPRHVLGLQSLGSLL